MKTHTHPPTKSTRQKTAHKPEAGAGQRAGDASKLQREAEARSRGDAPRATKPSERSPRQENL